MSDYIKLQLYFLYFPYLLICLNYKITVTHCYTMLPGRATDGIKRFRHNNYAIPPFYRMNSMVPLSTEKNNAARSFCPMTRLVFILPSADLPE